MTIELEIQQETASPDGIEDALKMAAVAVLCNEHVPSAMITILLTDDDSLRALNRRFRSEDKPTDVLSFSFGDELSSPGSDLPYLGDIAISVPFAHRQAEARGHSTKAELQLLTIHGILHLLGYDHGTEAEKGEMWRVQRNVLDQLDLTHVEPTDN
jgi:probable rRNA maturation factor